MTARRDPPRRVTPEHLAFYKKKAQRLRRAAQRRWRRRLCRWLAHAVATLTMPRRRHAPSPRLRDRDQRSSLLDS